MDLFNKCLQYYPRVETAIRVGYYPYFIPLSSEPDRRVEIDGRELVMLGSNNYLGLTTHPKLKEAAVEAIHRYGTGCTGSRFLNGTLDLHVRLERELAEFYGKEECIVFSTGYQTNLGVISSLIGKNDIAITDRLDHASIMDGCKMSYGTIKRFQHNDPQSLEHLLERLPPEAGKLVVVDGVFSMEGDLAPLDKHVPIAKRFGCRFLVDDAHAVGVMGPNGRGTAAHFGLEDEVDLILGTFSKSFASIGGYAVGERKVITFIRHNANSMLFSAALPASAVATVLAALEIMRTEPERRERLWRTTRRMHEGLRAMGYDIGNTVTPIIPIHIGEDMKTLNFWRALFDGGIFANPVVPPAVPLNRSLIRTSYMASHTDEDIDLALELFERIGRKFGLLA